MSSLAFNVQSETTTHDHHTINVYVRACIYVRYYQDFRQHCWLGGNQQQKKEERIKEDKEEVGKPKP